MARYDDAVRWIADNDDVDLGLSEDEGAYLVSICLVADIFRKHPDVVYADIVRRRRIDYEKSRRQIEAEYDEEDRMLGEPNAL